jgi:AcrR family transcriptional regulator
MNKTKRKILDTALNLFSSKGFDGTSVRDIAGKVGIRESAIYNHFGSKEEILKNLVVEHNSNAESLQIINDELLDELGNPHKFMLDFAMRLIQLWSIPEERKYFRLISKEQNRVMGEITISINSHLRDVRSIWWMIFDELVKYNFVRESDPKLLAEEFLSPLFLYRIEKLTDPNLPSVEQTNDFIIKHVNFFWESARKK